jgi:predicted hydrocarbon binding protein
MSDVQEAFYRLAPHILDAEVSDDGTIEFADRRFVYFHTDMFSTLFEKMKEVGGPVIDRKIQEFGDEAGHGIAAKMDAEFESVNIRDALSLLQDSGFDIGGVRELGKTDTRSQIEKIFGYGRHVGWIGPAEILEYDDGTEIRIATTNTFESTSYGQTGNKECSFLTGVLKGMMAYFWDTEDLHVEETSCACEGEDRCIMVVRRDDRS